MDATIEREEWCTCDLNGSATCPEHKPTGLTSFVEDRLPHDCPKE